MNSLNHFMHVSITYIVIIILYTCQISGVNLLNAINFFCIRKKVEQLYFLIYDNIVYDFVAGGQATISLWTYDGNVCTYTKSLPYKLLEFVPKQVLFNLILYSILFAILVLGYTVEYLSQIIQVYIRY